MLHVTAADRRALRLPWSALLANKAAEILKKALGRPFSGHGLIGADAATVARGFGALDDDGFATYNLPQRWVERRQIPAAMDGRVPAEGAAVLDLGCGPGTSTDVLCHFADPSWTIIGYDLTERFVASAERRAREGGFRNRAGAIIRPWFVHQSIAEPLSAPRRPHVDEAMGDVATGDRITDPIADPSIHPPNDPPNDPSAEPPASILADARLADASVDFAVSGGVVGLYMRAPDVERLVAELYRVVRPGGYIALDAGPAVPVRDLRRIAVGAGFVYAGSARSFWIEPRPKLVFRRSTVTDSHR